MDVVTPAILADWIIADHHRRGEPVTNLRLQKLLYYVQAWHLAINDAALFEEDFQAWIHGPVLPSQYRRFKAHGPSPIPVSADTSGDEDSIPLPSVSDAVTEHLHEVLEIYGPFNTWKLEQMTHSEKPWIEARGSIPIDAPSQAIISKDAMKSFYASLIADA